MTTSAAPTRRCGGDRLAAATSTAGRVGDVPQLGAGFFADDRGGASATGEGEAIAEFEAETGARAGVVVLDHEGRVGREHNTAAMQTARADGP